ncbi:hypothetical protein VE01_03327 [Pseudogymnoascus verrucosus]|uniref:J domain-containing protein n=1 Tax=Pseudogymnoascus verrucosus TaxID=342668 RepID=A0A1B8GSP8_9PEZI|nr:uncharacterized protein VE01_03327 [Pseudogymnoascus verrucosus]OBT98863.1 hypothetical protein VE01_03327 [Pseudogymnoascus verrucosus]
MKLSLAFSVVACAVTLVAAWSKEDQEIFRLRDEIALSEGPEVTFYDFLNLKQNANHDEITKAYKKRSLALHPDKVKQKFIASRTKSTDKSKKPAGRPSNAEINAAAKAASDRFARLGLVQKLLKGPERARYDHFLANGFPVWKGTGYYYARFRPGFGTVLLGLFIFVGGAGHYFALYLGWKRQQEFVGRYVKFARRAAGSANLTIPGIDAGAETPPATDSDAEAAMQPMNRRQRRMQEKDSRKEKPEKKVKAPKAKVSPADTPTGVTGPKKRVVAENGKILVVDAVGNVYLEQRNDDGEMQELLLDPAELQSPRLRDTALIRLPVWIYAKTAGRFLSPAPAADSDSDYDEGDDFTSENDTAGETSGATRSRGVKKVRGRKGGRK